MGMSVFEKLNAINVNGHTEKKNGLTYLSWAWAWAELLKAYPDATYTVYENKDGWCYHTDGRTAWVKTGVTVEGKEHIEFLPVMDTRNRSIPLESITSFDVNKAIQRSLTKAVARHGLGLYIYAGEDLPEEEAEEKKTAKTQRQAAPKQAPKPEPIPEPSLADILRAEILDLVHGDAGRVNAYLARTIKGSPKLEDLTAEQLTVIKSVIEKKVQA